MSERKEKRYTWTDVPNPKCRLCKKRKLHTKAQHELSKRRFEESSSMFSGWQVQISSWK